MGPHGSRFTVSMDEVSETFKQLHDTVLNSCAYWWYDRVVQEHHHQLHNEEKQKWTDWMIALGPIAGERVRFHTWYSTYQV